VRYYGGKWKIARWIVKNFPKHRTYVEPYGGGASVLLRKTRSYAEIYNDLDDDIVTVFRVLRDEKKGKMLHYLLHNTPFARVEWEESYEETADEIEKARRVIIRSFMGYGSDSIHRKSGLRVDSNRSGAPPARGWMHHSEHVEKFVERLRGVVIEQRPATDVIKQYDNIETLIYADPPYHTRKGKERYRHKMTEEEHIELAMVLRKIEGMAVVSGYRSDLYDELYRDWRREDAPPTRNGANGKTQECIWLSRNIPPNQEGFF